MKDTYVFEYTNENEFKKLERSLKKYNMLAYKKLYFDFYPSLKEGKLLGDKTDSNPEFSSYELKLPTDVLFSKVHGNIKLHYKVYPAKKTILLEKITPLEILSEGHQSELVTYKGVMVSKINLLNMIQKN